MDKGLARVSERCKEVKNLKKLAVKSSARKLVAVIAQLSLMTAIYATNAFAASTIDISGGLQTVNSTQMAGKIMAVAIGIAGLAGATTVIMLMYNGGRLGGKEKTREEAKEGITWSLIGLVIIGLGSIIVGFIAYLITQAQTA